MTLGRLTSLGDERRVSREAVVVSVGAVDAGGDDGASVREKSMTVPPGTNSSGSLSGRVRPFEHLAG